MKYSGPNCLFHATKIRTLRTPFRITLKALEVKSKEREREGNYITNTYCILETAFHNLI